MSKLHYKASFKSELGKDWTIYIWSKSDDTGTEQDFLLSSTGFKLKYKKGKDLRSAGVMPSDVTFAFSVGNDTERDFIHAMLTDDNQDWYIKIHSTLDSPTDTNLYWAGWSSQSFDTYENMPYPYFVNIKANDSLGRLVDKYNNTVETNGVDDYQNLLYPLQFFNDLYDIDTIMGTSHYKYYTKLNWWNSETTYNFNTNSARETFYNRSAFVRDNDNFPLIIGNYLDEMKGVFKTFGTRCLMSNGRYYLQQDNNLDADNVDYFACTEPSASGTEFHLTGVPSTVDIDNSTTTTIESGADIMEGGTYTFDPELNSIRAKYIHGDSGVLFDISNDYSSLTTVGIIGQGTSDYLLNLNLHASETWDNTVVVPITGGYPSQTSLISVVWEMKLKVGNYYLSDSGSWTLDSSNTFKVFSGCGVGEMVVGGMNPISFVDPNATAAYIPNSTTGYDKAIAKFTQQINIPTLPSYGEVQFQVTPTFYYWSDTFATQISINNLITPEGVAAENATFGGSPYSTNQWIGTIPNPMSLVTNSQNSSQQNDDNGVIGSSFISSQNPATQNADFDFGTIALGEPLQSSDNTLFTLAYLDGSTYTPTEGFRVGNSGDYINSTQLLLNEYLKGQDKPVTILQATIRSGQYSPHMTLKYDAKIGGDLEYWVFIRGTFSANLDEWNGEWYMLDLTETPSFINTDDVITVFDPPIDGGDSDDSPGGGGTTSPGPFPPKHGGGLNTQFRQASSTTLRGNVIGVITSDVASGSAITSITITDSKCLLKDGQIVTMCDSSGGNPLELIIDGDISKSTKLIDIESITPQTPYFAGGYLTVNPSDLMNHSSGGSPAGNTSTVQFNDGGSFGGADFLEIDKTSKNLNILGGGDIVLDSDVDGGSGVSVIMYPDDYDGTNRAILTIHNPDIVALSNRARNGTVQIRANGSSAGSGDEEIVAIFTDTALNAEKPIVLRPESIHPTSTTNTLYNLDGFPYFDKDGLTRTKKIGITIAQYKALETTSIELIAAPGSGYKICVSGIMIFADRTSTETSSNNLYIGQSSPSTTGGNYTGYLRDFMNNETGDRTYNCPLYTGEISQGNTDNRALQVYAGGSGFNGDVELDIYVTYSIIES